MSTRRKVTIAVMSVIALVLLGYGVLNITNGLSPQTMWWNRSAGYRTGMMGTYGNTGIFGMMGGYSDSLSGLETKTDAEMQADITAAQADAQVDEQANTVTYTGDEVKLVFVGGPEEADEKFVVNGLVNPTVYIPKGATVTLEFINADEGMPHAFEITTVEPPYYYMAMMGGGVYPGSFISTLPDAQNDAYPSVEITFEANIAGTFYYICQYPGHAQEGMYGKLIIE